MKNSRLQRFRQLSSQGGEHPVAQRARRQLAFLLEMSAAEDGRFDDTILPQVERLYSEFRREGAVTPKAVQQVEGDLSLLEREAKKYKISVVAQPDFGRQLTPVEEIHQVRLALALVDAVPGLVYFEPRPFLYRLVEKANPFLLEQIKKRVKDDRWQVGITCWPGRVPMPLKGEDVVENLRAERDYLCDLFDLSSQHPFVCTEIFQQSSSPFLLSRLADLSLPILYTVGGPAQQMRRVSDGADKEVLWLQGRPAPPEAQRFHLESLFGDAPTLSVLQVLTLSIDRPEDNWRMIHQLRQRQDDPLYGEIVFENLLDFCQRGQENGGAPDESLLFTGWYGDREFSLGRGKTAAGSERSERLDAQAALLSPDYIQSAKEIPKSCAEMTEEHAANSLALMMNTQGADLHSDKNTGFEQVHYVVHESPLEGWAPGYKETDVHLATVFNLWEHPRTQTVEMTIPRGAYPPQILQVVDSRGQEVPFQIEKVEEDQLELCFVAHLPSFGYATYEIRPGADNRFHTAPYPRPTYQGGGQRIVLENPYLRACFSAEDMTLLSLYCKEEDRELLPTPAHAGSFILSLEEPVSRQWPYGVVAHKTNLNQQYPVVIQDAFFGPARCWVDYEIVFAGGRISARVMLTSGSQTLQWRGKAEWNPAGLDPEGNRSLSFYLPCPPYATEAWVAFPEGALPVWGENTFPQGLGIFSKSPSVGSTLGLVGQEPLRFVRQNGALVGHIYSPCQPGGTVDFQLGVAIGLETPQDLAQRAQQFSLRPKGQRNSIHPGHLPPSGQLLSVKGECTLTRLWWAREEGAEVFYLRLSNETHEAQPVSLEFARKLQQASLVNLELESYQLLHRSGQYEIDVDIPARSLQTLKIVFALT